MSNYGISPADLSGNVDLDWTWDLSHIGIDLSPIGGPDWDLGTWGIEPIAVAYAGTQIDLETQFFAEGNEVASAVQIDVDIPIENTEIESNVENDDISEESTTLKLFDKLKEKILK